MTLYLVRKINNGYDDGFTVCYSLEDAQDKAYRWNAQDNDRGIYYSVFVAKRID